MSVYKWEVGLVAGVFATLAAFSYFYLAPADDFLWYVGQGVGFLESGRFIIGADAHAGAISEVFWALFLGTYAKLGLDFRALYFFFSIPLLLVLYVVLRQYVPLLLALPAIILVPQFGAWLVGYANLMLAALVVLSVWLTLAKPHRVWLYYALCFFIILSRLDGLIYVMLLTSYRLWVSAEREVEWKPLLIVAVPTLLVLGFRLVHGYDRGGSSILTESWFVRTISLLAPYVVVSVLAWVAKANRRLLLLGLAIAVITVAAFQFSGYAYELGSRYTTVGYFAFLVLLLASLPVRRLLIGSCYLGLTIVSLGWSVDVPELLSESAHGDVVVISEAVAPDAELDVVSLYLPGYGWYYNQGKTSWTYPSADLASARQIDYWLLMSSHVSELPEGYRLWVGHRGVEYQAVVAVNPYSVYAPEVEMALTVYGFEPVSVSVEVH